MAFINSLGRFARKAGEKAGAAIEIGRLTTKIHGEKSEIDRCKLQIGEIVWNAFEDGEAQSPEIAELCEKIRDSKASVEILRNAIDAVKNPEECDCCDEDCTCGDEYADTCPTCGAEVPADSRFCSECGTRRAE